MVPRMQAPMLVWLRDIARAAKIIDSGEIAGLSGIDVRSLAETSGGDDPLESLAAVRVYAMKLRESAVMQDAAAADDALLDACDAIASDDGSSASLAKFHAALNRMTMQQARAQLRRTELIAKAVPTVRPGPGRCVDQELVVSFLAGVCGSMHAIDVAGAELPDGERPYAVPATIVAPPDDGAGLLGWAMARAEDAMAADPSDHVTIAMAECFRAFHEDDGSDVSWRSAASAMRRFILAAAKKQYDEAVRTYG